MTDTGAITTLDFTVANTAADEANSSRRAGTAVAVSDVDALADMTGLAAELDEAMSQVVTGLRTAGYSWTEIAARLGVTRQAAQQPWEVRLRRQPERRVPIGDQYERVGGDPVVPAEHTFDEAKYATRVTAGEQDREPGHDHREERGDLQEEQHDVMRDGQQPFDQRQPPVEVRGRVRIGVIKLDPLVVIGGWITVVHQGEVGPHPVDEALQFQVPVEPPPGVLLPEQDHQQRAEEQQAARACGAVVRGGVMECGGASRGFPGRAGNGAEHDRDRDDHENPEQRGQPAERPVRVLDGKLNRILSCIGRVAKACRVFCRAEWVYEP